MSSDIDELLAALDAEPDRDVCLGDADASESNPERAEQTKRVKGLERMIPAKVRQALPRNFYFRVLMAESVVTDAEASAVKLGRSTHETGIRRVVAESWDSLEYRRWVRSLRRDLLKQGHEERRGKDRTVPNIEPRSIPGGSSWTAEGDLGLGLDAVLESSPDEVAVCLASMIVRVASERRTKTRAVVLGASSSAVGLCVDGIENGLGRTGSRVEVIEVDAFDWPRGSRCIYPERLKWDAALAVVVPQDDEQSIKKMVPPRVVKPWFDIVLFTPPCPALGVAAQARNRYLFSGAEESRTACDPGRYGIPRWTMTLGKALARAIEQMRPGGTVVGLLPLGLRATFQDATGEYAPGLTYVDSEEPWDSLMPVIRSLGLVITRTIEVAEKAPKRTPFVADRRPRFRLFVAHKEAR